jgi:multidrug efflux pump subunit AcrA (membrane-fusion protein)
MGDFRTTIGESIPLTRKARRRRLLWIGGTILVLLAAVVYAGVAIKMERYAVASGYVTTREYAEVRPPTSGTVAKIEAHSGDKVEKGQVLVRLDAEEEEASLEEAKRKVEKLAAEQERRRAQIEVELQRRQVTLEEQKRNLQDAINIARLQLKNAQSKLKRTRELVERGLKAASALEDDSLKEQLAQAQLASLLAKDLTIYETLLAKDKAAYQNELAAMEQDLEAQRDVVRRAEARLRAKMVRAPIAGTVLRYEFVVGELVRPETVLFEIFGGDEKVLKLRIAERYATKVAPGQKYSAVLASFSGLQTIYFTGRITRLRNVIQAEGRQTYRVAYGDFDDRGFAIPPGTTAEARIYYGRSCLWFYLFNIDL